MSERPVVGIIPRPIQEALDAIWLGLACVEMEVKERRPSKAQVASETESNLTKHLADFFRLQNGDILSRMPKGQLASIPVDLSVTNWTDSMTSAMTPVIRPAWDAAGNQVVADLGLDPGVWKVVSPTLAPQIASQAFHFADSTNRTTSLALADAYQALRDALMQGLVAEGNSLPWMTQRVKEIFRDATDYRARSIAATETARAQNLASLEAARQSGVVAGKRLLLSSDACAKCHAVKAAEPPNGWPLDATMYDDGSGHEYYSQAPSPPLHVNCRCTLEFILAKEYTG